MPASDDRLPNSQRATLIAATLIGTLARLYLSLHPIGGVEIDRLRATLAGQFSWDPFRPPLFYLLMYVWRPFALTPLLWRLPIVCFSIASVPSVYLFTKKLLKDREVAFWAAFITALSAFQMDFAHWLSDYPILAALFLWNNYCFLKMQEENGGKRFVIGFVLSHILSLQTHYMSLDILIFQAIYVFWRKGWKSSIGFFKWVVVVLLFAPWWLTLWRPMSDKFLQPWTFNKGLIVPFTYFSYLTGLNFIVYQDSAQVAGHWEVWAVFAFFGALLIRHFVRRRPVQIERFLLFMLGVSVLFFWLLSFRLTVFGAGLPKYTFPFALFFYVIMALAIKDLPSRWARWGTAAVYLMIQAVSVIHMANQLFRS